MNKLEHCTEGMGGDQRYLYHYIVMRSTPPSQERMFIVLKINTVTVQHKCMSFDTNYNIKSVQALLYIMNTHLDILSPWI